MVRINPPPSTTQGSTIQFIFLHYRFFTVELYSFIIESSMFFKVIRRIIGSFSLLRTQNSLGSTQSTALRIFWCSESKKSSKHSADLSLMCFRGILQIGKFLNILILEDSSESCELEACKQAKIVLCVLSSACRLSSQISPKIQGLRHKFDE